MYKWKILRPTAGFKSCGHRHAATKMKLPADKEGRRGEEEK
jgi:hypothetical protein